MPRPKRKQVNLDKQSIEQILQESYNETCENRSKAVQVLNKQLRDVNDNNDIQQVGKVNNELLRIIDSSISKKLEIVKLQISLVKTDNSSESTSSVHLTDEDKELIQNMIKESEEGEDKGISYDI
mgnify:FL=1|jgi:hypothetical protein|tara:strand:- start:1942 stop:2316 length:375 start_codon:yes stop_codon:yes gene_type:complete